jgi:hypothetical protein
MISSRLQDAYDSIQDNCPREALADLRVVCCWLGYPIEDEKEARQEEEEREIDDID